MLVSNEHQKIGYNLRWHSRDEKILFKHNTVIHLVTSQRQIDVEIEANERYLELQRQIRDMPVKENITKVQIGLFIATTLLLVSVWLAGKYL